MIFDRWVSDDYEVKIPISGRLDEYDERTPTSFETGYGISARAIEIIGAIGYTPDEIEEAVLEAAPITIGDGADSMLRIIREAHLQQRPMPDPNRTYSVLMVELIMPDGMEIPIAFVVNYYVHNDEITMFTAAVMADESQHYVDERSMLTGRWSGASGHHWIH